jgi:hypothetical protein
VTVHYRHAEATYDGVGVRITQSRPVRLPPPSETFRGISIGGLSARWSDERGELEWTEDGRRHRVSVDDPTSMIRQMMAEGRTVEDIDIVRTDLTQVYLSIIQHREGEVRADGPSSRRWLLGGRR